MRVVGRSLPGPDCYENPPHSAMGLPRRITLPHSSSCSFLQAAVGVVTRGLRPVLPDTVPQALSRLVERCWSRDVAERPAFSELTSTLQRMLEEEREATDGGSLRQPTYASAEAGPAPPCASFAFSEQMPAAVHTTVHTTIYEEHARPSQQRRMAGSSGNILASSLAAEDGHESDSSCAPMRGLSA